MLLCLWAPPVIHFYLIFFLPPPEPHLSAAPSPLRRAPYPALLRHCRAPSPPPRAFYSTAPPLPRAHPLRRRSTARCRELAAGRRPARGRAPPLVVGRRPIRGRASRQKGWIRSWRICWEHMSLPMARIGNKVYPMRNFHTTTVIKHYKKCSDLWRKFYDILMERHSCTQSMTNLKVWTLGPELYDVLLNSS